MSVQRKTNIFRFEEKMISVRIIFLIALDLKIEWFLNAKEGNLDNMKNIYKIMKEKGIEKDVKEFKSKFGNEDVIFYSGLKWSRLSEFNPWWRHSNRTILMEASEFGRLDVLKWVLHKLQFDVNEQNSNGDTALHWAAHHNQMECARLLLEQGSQNLRNRWGSTPLDYAKKKWHKDLQKLLESHFHSH